MKIDHNQIPGTLHKNDSLNSKGLFQVTEKNSENQSVLGPSQLQQHIVSANLGEYQSHKSLENRDADQRSSALFAELSRLERELKERGATPLMTRETKQDQQKRAGGQPSTGSDEQLLGGSPPPL